MAQYSLTIVLESLVVLGGKMLHCPAINVSTELEMTSDARQKCGKARNGKHCKCA